MSCNCQLQDCNTCNQSSNAAQVWQPSTTVARACQLVHYILNNNDCQVTCPDWDLCRLIRLECELHGGRYNIATLAMLSAAKLLEREAMTFARRGNVKTLTITYNGNQTASVLLEIARGWKSEAMKSAPRRRFGLVRTGRSCLSPKQLYNSCGCSDYSPMPIDSRLIDCNWDCCEECETCQ